MKDEDSHFSSVDSEGMAEFCDNHHITEPLSEHFEQFQDCFVGRFKSLEDFGVYIAELNGLFDELPIGSPLYLYFDFEFYARDLMLSGDFWQGEGSYFYFYFNR